MTNKDLLNAMQSLDAKYTDEADERAANAAVRRFSRIRPLPALVTLGSAAACFALLFGVVHMGRSAEQMQTAESVLSDVIVEETLPAAEPDAPEEDLGAERGTEVTTPAETAPEDAAVYSYSPAETTAAQEEKAAATTVSAPVKTKTVKAEVTPVQTLAPEAAKPQLNETLPPAATTKTSAAATSATELPILTYTIPQTDAPEVYPVYTNPTLTVENVTAKAGQVVPVRVFIVNNPGLSASGVRIDYDAALGVQVYESDELDTSQVPEDAVNDPVAYFSHLLGKEVTFDEAYEMLAEISGRITKPTVTFGSITENMHFSTSINFDEHCVAYGIYSNVTELSKAEEMRDDGEIITFYFIVPENAAKGTVYNLTAEVNQWLDSEFNLYEIDTVSGSITVK